MSKTDSVLGEKRKLSVVVNNKGFTSSKDMQVIVKYMLYVTSMPIIKPIGGTEEEPKYRLFVMDAFNALREKVRINAWIHQDDVLAFFT
jgi:hypothetical protein